MKTVKVIEQGNGWTGVRSGAELFDGDDLLRVVSVGSRIHTDHPRGNYIMATVVPADRDATSLTDDEFAELPQVCLEAWS